MYKNLLLFLFIVSCFFPISVLGQEQWILGGFDSPVSVAQYGGHLYLSNSGNNYGLDIEDGDGYISRIRSDGLQQEPTKFITGLNNPRGISAIDGILYVCDINRLSGFDLRTQRKVFDVSFEKENTMQLTAITSVNDKIIYLSATDINTIFEVDISTGHYKKWMEIAAPSGLLIDNGKMYVCSMGTDNLPNGKLGVVDMKTKEYSLMTADEGFLYGLALNGKRLYYSDWMQFAKRGVIKWVDVDTKSTGQLKFTIKIGGPADFLYDARNDLFIIPAVLENSVHGCIGFTK